MTDAPVKSDLLKAVDLPPEVRHLIGAALSYATAHEALPGVLAKADPVGEDAVRSFRAEALSLQSAAIDLNKAFPAKGKR